MPNFIDTATSIVKNKRIPYNYIVGEKSSGSLPFDVKLSLDPDFKKTIIKSVTILSIGIGLGTLAGIVISNSKKK